MRLSGIGPFGGWNLFLNRRLRIEVSFRALGTVAVFPNRAKLTFNSQPQPVAPAGKQLVSIPRE